MAKTTIISGMSGAEVRAALNNNFSELFLSGIRRVGSGGYATIQAAIDDAVAGETVLIAPGTYTENLTLKVGVDLASIGNVTLNGNITLGVVNPYVADVTGTKDIYKDNTCTNFANFLAYNITNSGVVNISLKNITGNVNTYSGYTLNILGCSLAGAFAYDESHIICNNCKLSYRTIAYQKAIVELQNSTLTYDQDILPLSEVGNIYDSSRWGNYVQGSHVIEPLSTYNKDLIATIVYKKVTINYMGDDVLNGLAIDVALANLAVNTGFKSDTTADPAAPNPIHADWVAGHAYVAGEFVPYNNKICYIVSNHTSNADINIDWRAGRIRTLFGAKLQDNGYYMSLYYSTTDNAWHAAHRLGQYHGGKYRNRGCAIYNYNNTVNPCNLIWEDVIINDHSGSWSLTSNVNMTLDKEGTGMYGGGTTIQAGADYTYFNNVEYNYINYWGDGADHYGVYINQSTQTRRSITHLIKVRFTGKAINKGIYVYVNRQSGGAAPADTKLYIDDYHFTEGSATDTSITQYYQGNYLIYGTSAVIGANQPAWKTYWDSYLSFKDNKNGSTALMNYS